MRNILRTRLAKIVMAVSIAGVAAVAGGAAYAATASTAPPVPNRVCYSVARGTVVAVNGSCPRGDHTLPSVLFPRGPRGLTGARGPQGIQGRQGIQGKQGVQGVQGPSGIVSAGTDDLGRVASVATGGSFVANSTEVGSGVPLPAGTYLISLSAKATPRASGDTAQIFPQFFVYDQVKNSSFTGNLLNVGAGALEPDGTNHDSYYSGFQLITLSAATTLHVYAFGYDSDTGAGAYVLDDLSITAVAVTPAS